MLSPKASVWRRHPYVGSFCHHSEALRVTFRVVAAKLHRMGKCYVFLREIRAELFDEAFEGKLAAAYFNPRPVKPVSGPAATTATSHRE